MTLIKTLMSPNHYNHKTVMSIQDIRLNHFMFILF